MLEEKEFIDSRREEIIFDMEHCTSLDEARGYRFGRN